MYWAYKSYLFFVNKVWRKDALLDVGFSLHTCRYSIKK